MEETPFRLWASRASDSIFVFSQKLLQGVDPSGQLLDEIGKQLPIGLHIAAKLLEPLLDVENAVIGGDALDCKMILWRRRNGPTWQ